MPITINYRNPFEFAPFFKTDLRYISVNSGTTVPITHRNLSAFIVTPAESTQVYDISGFNIENTIKTSEPAGSVDFSIFPTARATAGFTGTSRIFLENDRAKGASNPLTFSPQSGGYYYGGPVIKSPLTYAKYSIDNVIALADSLPNNKFLAVVNGVIVRQNLAQFPHEHVTGTCVAQNVDGVTRLAGYRPSAITKRHVVHCGHYGSLPIGRKLYFLPADNGPLVERTIVGGTNFTTLTDLDTLPIPFGGIAGAWDFEMCILNQDLPDSIKPYPISSPYITTVLSSNSLNMSFCSQGAAIVLWNNDGHISPTLCFYLEDVVDYPQGLSVFFDTETLGMVFDGLPIKASTCSIPAIYNNKWIPFNKDFDYTITGSKFYHNLRGGDSGSPILTFVGGNEFALSGFVSTDANPLPATYNDLIQRVDARAVAAGQIPAATGYTVRVATAPTL